MQIINCEQGSQEWQKARLGVATASNFGRIVSATGKLSDSLSKYALELATELMLIEQEESYKSEAMIRGNELEGEARAAYEEYNFVKVEQVGFVSHGHYGYSPDGLVEDCGLIEIKCPLAHNHMQILCKGEMPTKYKPQVQGGLYATDREWCDFISYHPKFKDEHKLFIKRIYRDEEYISKLKQGVEEVTKLKLDFLKKLGLVVNNEALIN